MQYPQTISTPAMPQAKQVTLIAPNGARLKAEHVAAFTPGRCGVRIGTDAWVGIATRIGPFHIAIDTVNGLDVFDLREVQLLRLIE